MSQWCDIKLKDLCEKVTVGYVGPMAHEYQDAGITFLRSLNIKPFRLELTDVKFVSEQFHHRIRKSALHPGDVAVVRTGYPGTAAVVPGSLPVSNCSDLVIIRPGKNLNPHFLTAIFNSAFGQTMVSGNTVGAAQQHFNITVAKELRFRVPPKAVQDKIAAILSAYDELIENNRRRIALLEKLVEEIYREWFVRLRFPGHEKVKKVKGVPDGWKVKKLGELVRTQYGYTASAESEDIGPKLLRITDIVPAAIDWKGAPHCKIEEKDEAKYLLQEGDIVVARTGATVGYAKRINKRHPKAVFASYLVRLTPNQKSDAVFLGLSVERNAFKDFIDMFVTGAAQPQANATTMALFPVLHPPEPLLKEFNRIAEPILDKKEILLAQNAALANARDKLLPRLISGKLSVEDLDIQFPPGMAEELNAEPTVAAHA